MGGCKRKKAFIAWSIAVVVAIGAIAPLVAWGQAAQAVLETGPISIEARAISTAEPSYVLVRLKAGAQPLSDIVLSTFSNDGISANIEDGGSANVAALVANGEHVWKLRLVPSQGAMLAPAPLSLQIQVASKEGTNADSHPRYLFNTLKITAPAQDATPTLEFGPATLEGQIVTSNEPLQVQLRLKAGAQDLSEIALATFSNDPVTISVVGEPTAASLAALPANAEHVWTLRIEPRKGAAFSTGAVAVYASVAFKQGRDVPRQRYAFQTLKITAPQAVTIPALIDIEIKGSLQAVSHERRGRLFVIVTNKHSQAVRVTNIALSELPFIKFGTFHPEPPPPSFKLGTSDPDFKDERFSTVPYGEARVFSYEVVPSDQIVPGKYPVVVVVSAGTSNGISGTATKTQEVELTVLGESDLLSKLGAPSLLFLPGVLFLLTWQMLWSIGKTAVERGEYKMTPTSGSFWLVAVVISLLAAKIYPGAVRLIIDKDEKRDYLVSYGLIDFIYVFALTIAAAAALFLLWCLLRWIGGQIKAWVLYLNTPNEDDTPISILRKLSWLRADTRFRQAHAGNPAELALILEPWREPAHLWLTPPAVLEPAGGAPADALNFIQQVATGEITSAKVLARRLQAGLQNGWWTLAWQPVGGLARPRKDPAAGWTEVPAEARLVRPDL